MAGKDRLDAMFVVVIGLLELLPISGSSWVLHAYASRIGKGLVGEETASVLYLSARIKGLFSSLGALVREKKGGGGK